MYTADNSSDNYNAIFTGVYSNQGIWHCADYKKIRAGNSYINILLSVTSCIFVINCASFMAFAPPHKIIQTILKFVKIKIQDFVSHSCHWASDRVTQHLVPHLIKFKICKNVEPECKVVKVAP